MAEHTISTTIEEPEKEIEEEVRPLAETPERIIGKLESEVGHQAESIVEHGENIQDLKGDREWITTELKRLEELITQVPRVPLELVEDLVHRVKSLENHLETSSPETKEELTQIPEVVEEPKKVRRSLLDRIL